MEYIKVIRGRTDYYCGDRSKIPHATLGSISLMLLLQLGRASLGGDLGESKPDLYAHLMRTKGR